MRIRLITPAPKGSRQGNRVTALRWARIFRKLGHRVVIENEYSGSLCDLLVALHARRSFPSVKRFRTEGPEKPLVVALTGTDVYRDLKTTGETRQSLDWATIIVTLQPLAAEELPKRLRRRVRSIYQSATRPANCPAPLKTVFEVCVMSHLRDVKDPFLAAEAARLLPSSSRIRITHIGEALESGMDRRARKEISLNPLYRWVGGRPRWEALRLLARSRLLVLPSKLEGGANVVSEAIACSVPVLSSRVQGSVGMLGKSYPGYFPVGDAHALSALLRRAEGDTAFYKELKMRCERLKPLVDPAREMESWACLLNEITIE